jgi:hypothetical protein
MDDRGLKRSGLTTSEIKIRCYTGSSGDREHIEKEEGA